VINFKVPGRPEKKMHINIIDIARFGATCKIPEISNIDLE